MLRPYSWVLLALLIPGCARVHILPLDPDGVAKLQNAAEGLRFYRPKPYLLVVALPPPASAAGIPTSDRKRPSEQEGKGAGAETKNETEKKDGTASTSTSSSSPSTSTGFSAVAPQYVVKLIYLPDYSHPFAISASAGMGTAQMNPVLQDGWMLTSVNSTSDSKVPETLTALAGGLKTVAGAFAESSLRQQTARPEASTAMGGSYLSPGLYAFEETNGVITGLKRLASFDIVQEKHSD